MKKILNIILFFALSRRVFCATITLISLPVRTIPFSPPLCELPLFSLPCVRGGVNGVDGGVVVVCGGCS